MYIGVCIYVYMCVCLCMCVRVCVIYTKIKYYNTSLYLFMY